MVLLRASKGQHPRQRTGVEKVLAARGMWGLNADTVFVKGV